MIYRFNDFLNESSFSKLKKILTGQHENVDSIGIITAENPMAEAPDVPDSKKNDPKAVVMINNKLNIALEYMINKMDYQFIKIRGKYGLEEDSYVVLNIKKDEVIKLGKIFRQEAVIWGEKVEEMNFSHFRFYFLQNGQPEIVRNVVLSSEDIQKREDFYSMIKGRKFLIPFFDEDKKPIGLGKYE